MPPSTTMQRVVIGTAGHIDHGKTTLIQALTGIDCDRFAEEKARGITIDLGFAHLEAEGAAGEPLQIGFVDVPGHERFLHNALAGLGGIRLMLLVVAADEGVKPQTREHVAICSLLGIPHAVVVLTKRDAVDDDLLELAELEIGEYLAATPYAEAPVMAVSSTTGEGIEALRDALIARAREVAVESDPQRPTRLPVDRAFQLRGLGVVITGTLLSGRLQVGDSLAVLPAGETARVRSLQVHGQERQAAVAGERTAAQLSGIELQSIGRGEELLEPGVFTTAKSLVARFTLWNEAPEALASFVPIRLHLYAREALGKMRPLGGPIEPGASGLVEIRLAQKVVAARGDRFIVRRPSPATTLGGGEILDPLWRRRRGPSLAAAGAALGDLDRALELWVGETRERGAAATELAPRLGWRASEVAERLEKSSRDGRLLRVEASRGGVRFLTPSASQRVTARAEKALADYFAANRLARGMPKAELLARVLPRRAADLGDVYLGWLEAQKKLVREGDLVNLPGREARLSGEESQLAKQILAEIEAAGLEAPSPAELAERLGTKAQILNGVVRYLVEQEKLVRLPSGLIVAAAAIEKVKDELRDGGEEWRQFNVARFKDRFGLSRKWAIPLLEHLDSVEFTRRVGDERQIVTR